MLKCLPKLSLSAVHKIENNTFIKILDRQLSVYEGTGLLFFSNIMTRDIAMLVIVYAPRFSSRHLPWCCVCCACGFFLHCWSECSWCCLFSSCLTAFCCTCSFTADSRDMLRWIDDGDVFPEPISTQSSKVKARMFNKVPGLGLLRFSHSSKLINRAMLARFRSASFLSELTRSFSWLTSSIAETSQRFSSADPSSKHAAKTKVNLIIHISCVFGSKSSLNLNFARIHCSCSLFEGTWVRKLSDWVCAVCPPRNTHICNKICHRIFWTSLTEHSFWPQNPERNSKTSKNSERAFSMVFHRRSKISMAGAVFPFSVRFKVFLIVVHGGYKQLLQNGTDITGYHKCALISGVIRHFSTDALF